MEPGLTPDDSEKLMGVIKGAMDFCETAPQLSDWATENKDKIAMLLPVHRKDLQDYYKSRRDELKGNG